MKNSIITLIFSLLCGITMSAQQDTCAKAITLDAVYVTAEKVTYFRSKPNFVMLDFEVNDNKFFILQKKFGINTDYRVLITDLFYEPIDTIFLPKHIEPEHIILDCMNHCQIMGQDSVYQIVEIENDFIIDFPNEKQYYKTVMDNVLFITDKYLYLNELKLDGYVSRFYRINLSTKKKEDLFFSDDSKSYREVQRELKWHEAHMHVVNNICHSPSVEDWEVFIKNAWYHTKNCHLAKVADTLYYFDHLNKKIEAYDESMNKLHSCIITYPDSKDYWRYTIYQDRVFGTFYTILGTTLHEINIQTGKTTPKTHVNNFFSQKIIIYKGSLYSLKKRTESFTSEIPFIEKTNLK